MEARPAQSLHSGVCLKTPEGRVTRVPNSISDFGFRISDLIGTRVTRPSENKVLRQTKPQPNPFGLRREAKRHAALEALSAVEKQNDEKILLHTYGFSQNRPPPAKDSDSASLVSYFSPEDFSGNQNLSGRVGICRAAAEASLPQYIRQGPHPMKARSDWRKGNVSRRKFGSCPLLLPLGKRNCSCG